MIEVASDTGSFVSVNTRIRFLRAFDMQLENIVLIEKADAGREARGYQGGRAFAGPTRISCALHVARSLVGVLEQEC